MSHDSQFKVAELTADEYWLYRSFLPIFVPVATLVVIFLFGWYFMGFGLGLLYALGFPVVCAITYLILQARRNRAAARSIPIAQVVNQPRGQQAPIAQPVHPGQPPMAIPVADQQPPMAIPIWTQQPPMATPVSPQHPPTQPPAWVPGAAYAAMPRRSRGMPVWVVVLIVLVGLPLLGLLLIVVVPIILAIAIPNMLSSEVARNESVAIVACKTYAEAQDIYHRTDWDEDAVLEYAQSISGANSLYEKTAGAGDLQLVDQAFAMAEGTRDIAQPKNGYLFKILTRQRSATYGSEKNYVVNGDMTGGYALVAWPAEYGKSGRKTFMISNMGTVFERDLGADTSSICKQMTIYEPGDGWAVTDLAAAMEAVTEEAGPAPSDALKVVDKWLTALKQGQEGGTYWEDPEKAQVLFAVENWRVLNHQTGREEGEALVNARIWSATKHGQEIVKDWRIGLKKKNGRWVITSIEERYE